MEISRKCAEIESQLILERNLKASLELEIRKLASDNQILNERIRSLDEIPMDKKRLQNTVDLLEKEKSKLSEELDRYKQSSTERYEIMVNEREVLRTQQVLAEDKMLKTVNELQGHVTQLQSQLAASEQKAESQVKRLESSLKANQQKSQQYAKLIWKLRQRLVLNTQPSVTLDSLAHPQQQ
ncbi:hypothetical protein DAPPUDRAFT_311881 [Daphnia pulex]|uniref:Uncharacterized protein n=1 Tax=Daphnia pulex TaxID=6669 RepID=E9FY72_DAPPU|nr:hypothetical protein DAPPUDRAFT_311881 [Daphnia pulex]|eukprot:EFX87489.1 hypothetical protein DAPPUDRAFT_311881 [Daphnia pulex]